MSRLLTTTAVALLLGLAPAFAVEDTSKPQDPSGTKSEAGQLPAQSGVTPDAEKQATVPPEGSADTSTGAKEQSSAPPSSDAAADDDASKAAQSSDTSSGAKEQSSAPEGSSAADKSKPNPTMGPESSKE